MSQAGADALLLQGLEEELLRPATRSNSARLMQLLTGDFEEVGKSGRVYTRDQIVQLLLTEVPDSAVAFSIEHFTARGLAGDIVQVRYRLLRRSGDDQTATERTSLWRREEQGWRMCYHQGTHVSLV